MLQSKLCICMHMDLKHKNIKYIEKNASYLTLKVFFFQRMTVLKTKAKHQDLIS